MFMFCLVLLVLTGIAGAGVAYYIYEKYSVDLPDVTELKNYQPSLITKIYSDTNDKIGEFFIERRILVPIEEIPDKIIQATLSVEDSNFYSHIGIDFQGILRAAIKNFRAGHVVEGGSTITQQLTKTMFLSSKRKIERKIREAILALKIEENFTKSEILEIYLNQIYYGHGAYGVEAAAQTYFGKHIDELDISEVALIAALPRAPSHYSPYRDPERAKKRRKHVLRRLLVNGFIDEGEMEEAADKPFELGDRESLKNYQAPYFMEYTRRYIEDKYGSSKLYRSGFHIYTSLNLEYQKAAQKAVFLGLRANDKRYGYRGPLMGFGSSDPKGDSEKSHYFVGQVIPFPWEPESNAEENSILPGKILVGSVKKIKDDRVIVSLGYMSGEIALKDMDWARKPNVKQDGKWVKLKHPSHALKVGDLIQVRVLEPKKKGELKIRLALEQEPEVQGALLAVEPATGQIKAMVGGYDFNKSQFNRAIQARRQPGSSFKPIVYASALEKGYTPATIVLDSPVVLQGAEKDNLKWKPENYEEKFFGPTRIRTALAHSRNLVTIKITKDLGVKSIINFARRLGVKSPLARDLSLALGSSATTLREITSIYCTFANQGKAIEPHGIRYIQNREGEIIEERRREAKQVMSPENAYLMTSLLQSVVKEGTGKKVAALGRPVAGKTGTTNDCVDAWFIGFTPDLAAGVWVGQDKNEPLGVRETGARAAIPIWLDFMKDAHKKKPISDFPVPPGLVFKKIDEKTGLLAHFGEPYLFECFLPQTAPVQYATAETEKEDFLRWNSPR